MLPRRPFSVRQPSSFQSSLVRWPHPASRTTSPTRTRPGLLNPVGHLRRHPHRRHYAQIFTRRRRSGRQSGTARACQRRWRPVGGCIARMTPPQSGYRLSHRGSRFLLDHFHFHFHPHPQHCPNYRRGLSRRCRRARRPKTRARFCACRGAR